MTQDVTRDEGAAPDDWTALVLLRHGPTDWSQARRLQGRSDRPLSEAGRARVAGWRLPAELPGDLEAFDWVASPLIRTRETAALLGHPEAVIEPALIEMDWGAWEGRSLAELRAADPEGMAALEGRGLDLEPPGGESPRRVQARLQPWLARVGAARRPTVAVCHKGLLRAALSLAIGWDMSGPPPEKLRDDRCHFFRVGPGGELLLERLNQPLLRS